MPIKSLPYSPSLDHLKYQARDLHQAHNAGSTEALTRLRQFHPKFADADIAAAKPRATKFSLADAQLVIAREYGFPNWPKLKQFIQTPPSSGAAGEPAHEPGALESRDAL